jgi:hypothetical protein
MKTSRRRFLFTAAATAPAIAIPAMASPDPADTTAAASQPQDDRVLLELEEQIFEQGELASAYDGEITRLGRIWKDESSRQYQEALLREVQTGVYLSADERWRLVTDTPACIEHDRLCKLQDVHIAKMEALVKQMWAIPAHTPEGRRSKVLVALNLLPDDWRVADADYGIAETRELLIQFVGGELGEMLRGQFA